MKPITYYVFAFVAMAENKWDNIFKDKEDDKSDWKRIEQARRKGRRKRKG